MGEMICPRCMEVMFAVPEEKHRLIYQCNNGHIAPFGGDAKASAQEAEEPDETEMVQG